MASIRQLAVVGDTTDASAKTSPSFTPNAGELLVVITSKIASANVGTVTSSAGVTFPSAPQASNNFSAGADRHQFWIAEDFATNVAQTVTYDCTGDGYTGIVLQVLGITGMSRKGAAALLQQATNTVAAGGTPATTFAAACQTGNPTISTFSKNGATATVTAPSGWTTVSSASHATPSALCQTISRDSGFTGTTLTWGGTSAVSGRVTSLEFDTRPEDITITGTGFADAADAFGAGSLVSEIILAGTGFADADAFGAASLKISTGRKYGLGPYGESLYSFNPLVSVTGTGFADADAFGAGDVRQLILGITGFANVNQFGAGGVWETIGGTGFADADAFGAGELFPVTLINGTGFADPDAFGAAVLQPFIGGLGFADPDAFGRGRVIRVTAWHPEPPAGDDWQPIPPTPDVWQRVPPSMSEWS